MASNSQLATVESAAGNGPEQFYRIAEVAKLLHISRASVYNLLRGSRVVSLAGKKGKGITLVPGSVLREILDRRTKVYR